MTEDRPTAATSVRQKKLYDGLWRAARTGPLSPDLIRFRVWEPHLKAPVVDIGAGDGLLARTYPDLGVLSVDLSGIGLLQARPLAAVGAAEALPLPGSSMRTVVLSEVLEHAERPQVVLEECRRVLTADGLLLLSTPLWPLARAEAAYHALRIRQRPTLQNISRWDPNHERRYDLKDLVAHTEAAGFRVEQVVPLFGSGSTAMMYFVEPVIARATGGPSRLAQRMTAVDRLLGPVDHPSGAALVCRPTAAQ
jgi:SAM-dependent methyltransferase